MLPTELWTWIKHDDSGLNVEEIKKALERVSKRCERNCKTNRTRPKVDSLKRHFIKLVPDLAKDQHGRALLGLCYMVAGDTNTCSDPQVSMFYPWIRHYRRADVAASATLHNQQLLHEQKQRLRKKKNQQDEQQAKTQKSGNATPATAMTSNKDVSKQIRNKALCIVADATNVTTNTMEAVKASLNNVEMYRKKAHESMDKAEQLSMNMEAILKKAKKHRADATLLMEEARKKHETSEMMKKAAAKLEAAALEREEGARATQRNAVKFMNEAEKWAKKVRNDAVKEAKKIKSDAAIEAQNQLEQLKQQQQQSLPSLSYLAELNQIAIEQTDRLERVMECINTAIAETTKLQKESNKRKFDESCTIVVDSSPSKVMCIDTEDLNSGEEEAVEAAFEEEKENADDGDEEEEWIECSNIKANDMVAEMEEDDKELATLIDEEDDVATPSRDKCQMLLVSVLATVRNSTTRLGRECIRECVEYGGVSPERAVFLARKAVSFIGLSKKNVHIGIYRRNISSDGKHRASQKEKAFWAENKGRLWIVCSLLGNDSA